MTRLGRDAGVALALAFLIAVVLASTAVARNLYVPNYSSDTVSVIDGNTNQVVGSIPTGVNTGPWTLAITPDSKTVFVANYDSGSLVAIDTATNQIVGAPTAIPEAIWTLAITPDGTRAYGVDNGNGNLVAIDLQSRQMVGTPIKVCTGPTGLVITPDGSRAYVLCAAQVTVVDLATGGASPLAIENTYAGAVTPDGKSVYLADTKDGRVVVIDTATNQATPIATGGDPNAVAISADGKRAYVADFDGEGVIVIDTATRQVIPPVFPVSLRSEYVAVSPDGKKVFVTGYFEDLVAGLDTTTNQVIAPFGTGEGPGLLAFVPDQSPTASFALPAKIRPGVPATLNGAASTDSDGTIASFAWQFGDGGTETGPASSATHTYAKPGAYNASLTLTDNEGCSVPMAYTGQTASCHGSPAAAQTQTLQVKYPGVKVKCPKKAGPKGCKFKLKAVKKTGKGKKQKLQTQSAVAKAKVKAGKSKIVSLKPKKKFAKKLATAKKMVVQQKVTIDGETTTKVSKLKVVQ